MDFDYQWKNLPSPDLEYTEKRIEELLDYTALKRDFFDGKYCLDAGCGTGRWTWAMIHMGAKVDSFDISEEAVNVTRTINPKAYVLDIMALEPTQKYDFVLSWGVLHHLQYPSEAFNRVASQVKKEGYFHVMLYHKDTQRSYEAGRKIWAGLTEKEKIALCEKMVSEKGGTVHGWWDAFNPQYNWSFHHKEVKEWFKKAGFEDIKLVKKYNINMIGRRK
jgi:2-polyprenyl-3-methyl-5-hydroxy-6-metoxy-1,4-benzoquinol methylase